MVLAFLHPFRMRIYTDAEPGLKSGALHLRAFSTRLVSESEFIALGMNLAVAGWGEVAKKQGLLGGCF